MTKDDLIKKFPKPQFSKFPDSKITELIDLCLDTAKSYHQINEMIIIISNIIFHIQHILYLKVIQLMENCQKMNLKTISIMNVFMHGIMDICPKIVIIHC